MLTDISETMSAANSLILGVPKNAKSALYLVVDIWHLILASTWVSNFPTSG